MKRNILLVLAALLSIPTFASALAIPLVNTGSNGVTVLPHGAIDPNWTVSGGTGTDAIVIADHGVYPLNGAWIDDSPASNWLSTTRSSADAFGTYTFSTTFDLSGFDPATASISGRFAADNQGKVLLNGVDTGISVADEGFHDWTEFTINSGFINGVNTLSFVVDNIHDQSPVGVRVELSGDAAVGGGQVPEPSSVLVLGLGLAAALIHRRRSAMKIA